MRRASFTAGEGTESRMVSIADSCPVSGMQASMETPSCPFAKKNNAEAGAGSPGGTCPVAGKWKIID